MWDVCWGPVPTVRRNAATRPRSKEKPTRQGIAEPMRLTPSRPSWMTESNGRVFSVLPVHALDRLDPSPGTWIPRNYTPGSGLRMSKPVGSAALLLDRLHGPNPGFAKFFAKSVPRSHHIPGLRKSLVISITIPSIRAAIKTRTISETE